MDDRIIRKKLEILKGLSIDNSLPVTGWEARTADHLGPNEYKYDGEWKKITTPANFPGGKVVFIRGRVDVPGKFSLANTYIALETKAMEGLVFINGKPYSGTQIRFRVPSHGKLDLSMEFQSVPELFWEATLRNPESRFFGGLLFVLNRDVEGCYYDIQFAWEASKVVRDDRRRQIIDAAVEEALLAINVTLPRKEFLEEVRRARKVLRQKLAEITPDKDDGMVFLTGHTHIDTAWLWPIRETIRKCGRTFASSLRLMEEYPNYYFSCSQAQLYSYTKKYHPEIYRQIKKWVKEGRWETTGAMWVEADCNVSSGESLVRQILYGLRFYREEFGTRPRSCWLPDVFGYPASLPEILKGCGVDFFYTNKLHWQSDNPFPHNLFRWRGLDGTEVVAHIPKLKDYYNGFPNPEQLMYAWMNYSFKDGYPEVMLPYGYGDGGGGPNEIMLEYVARAKAFPGLPATRTGPSEKYFVDVEKKAPSLPVWDGELYLETHRGTYTTQSETKRGNRKSELMLRDAEIFGVLSGKTDRKTLDRNWENVLLNQFHDILPGSSIGSVYDQTRKDYVEIRRQVDAMISDSLGAMVKKDKATDGVRVFNSLSWSRADAVTAVVPETKGEISVSSGNATFPAQVVDRKNGQATIVFEPDEVPAIGYATFKVEPRRENTPSGLKVSTKKIESSRYVVELTRDGGISRLYDKEYKREVVPAGMVTNDLQLFQDDPEVEHAWNVHATSTRRRYAFEGDTKVQVIETGPVRAVVRVARKYGNSKFEQDIIVYNRTPRIDFVTRVDWNEKHTMLKVAFPMEIRTTRATYEIQFGAVERATHRNTSWEKAKFEVCGQRWADLSETGYGVSVLNDSRYGYDCLDNVLRLTLLRSTILPDPHADEGRHEFTYSLYPHGGDWRDGGTVQAAWELNVPARVAGSRIGENNPEAKSFVTLEGVPVVAETLKIAEDGNGLILRVYEPNGRRGSVTVQTLLPVAKVVACNLVEEGSDPVKSKNGQFTFEVKPFEIRTFRLIQK